MTLVGIPAGVPARRAGMLPVASTPLIDRDAELAALSATLTGPEARLITLTGPPGVGKTSLAIAAAGAVAPFFPDGVVFVDLTPIRDPGLVLPDLALALGVGDGPGRSLTDRIRTAVTDRDLLLVLDNFEHVLDAAAAVAEPLAVCPRLRILATSRERLNLRGEREYPVLPLTLPAQADAGDLDRLAATASVAMLVQRVRWLQPEFEITPANAGALAEICLRLDGLPLALELAAARMKLFTPAELTFRLRHRMGLLTSGARDGPDRHRTLRNALAWSHNLLIPDERAVFRRLSVFVGGWTLEAAQQVCGVADVVETTASLVDKSLVRRRGGHGDVAEFVMLESLREYAAELLADHDEVDATRDRHTGYYAAFAARSEAQIGTDQETASLLGHAVAEGNLREAFEHAGATGRTDLALSIAAALGWYFYTRGHLGQGNTLLDQALAAAATGPGPLPDDPLAAALQIAGVIALARGELDRAEELLDRGAQGGDLRRRAIDSAFRGHLARARSDHAGAVAHHDRARRLQGELGNAAGLAWSRYDLGLLARHQGDLAGAAEHLRAGLAVFRECGHAWAVGCAAWALATVQVRRGRVDEGAVLLAEAVGHFETMDDGRGLAQCLETAAVIACRRSDHGSSARLLGAAAVLRERRAAPLPDEDRAEHHALTQRVRRELGPDATEVARCSGRALPIVEALALAQRVVGPTGPALTGDAPPPAEPASPLTPRERQVARLIATGHTNRQIGRTLGITEKTAEVHVHHIIGKLGARSRSEVAAWVGSQNARASG